VYAAAYEGEAFVRVLPEGRQPRTASVAGSNRAQVGAVVDERRGMLVATCAIDNLVKGAAGQAVQNANLLCALDERLGLDAPVPLI
jgi:N-acetyl-gamma-glutamyl-phosphate reductase